MPIDPSAGIQALAREYTTLTHNLANASTTGFKRRLGVFTTAGADTGGPAGATLPNLYVDFTQGRLVQTGRALDVALMGKGFLVVETAAGERYTRHGVLRTNATGQIVDADGRTVAGQNGPIVVPPSVGHDQIDVAADGRVSAAGTEIGRLKVVEFEDTTDLEPLGDSLFRPPRAARPGEAAATTVHQGFQEASNVSTVDELVSLIRVSRLYEANVRAMQSKGDGTKALIGVAMA